MTWQFSMHSHSISFDIKDLSHPINHIWFHINFSSRTFACLIKSGIWYYSDKTHINRVFILRVKQSAKHLYQICIANTPVWFSLTKCILLSRPVNSPLKGPVTRKIYIIYLMTSSCLIIFYECVETHESLRGPILQTCINLEDILCVGHGLKRFFLVRQSTASVYFC